MNKKGEICIGMAGAGRATELHMNALKRYTEVPICYKRIIAHNSYFIQVYRPADPPFKRSKNCRLYKIDSVSCDSGIFDCTIPDIT